ncbi:13142_t:CDS:10, partial [Acaulospora colombiana]
ISEKFRLHAQDSKAEFLAKYVSSFMQTPLIEGSIPSHTRYDILCLILSLSEAPLQTAYIPPRSIFQERPNKPQFKVADIFREEPLTGLHWLNGLGRNWEIELSDPMEDDTMDGVKEIVDLEGKYELIQGLQSKQYWRPDYRDCSYLDGPSLAKHHSQDARYLFYDPTSVKYITELDAIREVLFMLSGRPSFLFHPDPNANGRYKVKLNALLMHLTEGAFKSILEVFCSHGNYLSMLRSISMRICRESYSIYGQTAQAFAASILDMILRFDNLLADLEAKYQLNNSKFQGQDTYISLLQLQNQISYQLYEFKILYEFFEKYLLHDFFIQLSDVQGHSDIPSLNAQQPLSVSPPHELAYKILSGLVDEIVRYQIEGNKLMFLMFGGHLDNSFAPFIRMIDEWVNTGVLNDPANEFFIVRALDINALSSSYWSEMYKVRVAKGNLGTERFLLPSFLEPLVDRILFSGKARNLLMSLKLKEEDTNKYSLEFQYNPKEFDWGVESLPLFDMSMSNNKFDPSTEFPYDFNQDSGIRDTDMDIDEFDDIDPEESQINDIGPEESQISGELAHLEENRTEHFNSEEREANNIEKGGDQKEADEGYKRLLGFKNLSDLNDIVDFFPKTMSSLFSLWDQPTKSIEKTKDTGRMDDFTLFQPFNERLKERYDEYLQPRYLRIGQQLYNALIDRNQMWYDTYILSDLFLNILGNFKWLDKNLITVWVDDKSNSKPNITTVKIFEKVVVEYHAVPIHKSILNVLDLTIQFSTLYTRYQGENVSFYDHSRDERSRRHIDVDNNSDSDSDSFSMDEEEDQWNKPGSDGVSPLIPAQVDYDAFLEGLSRIDREFNRNKEFVSNSVQGIAKVGGFWWFDALALALG